ncbi:helix-turn-helix domain-containing protein [Mucilaginibacter ginsenosidivorans]|uniref:Helix-turn-helix transcriptional regulator n=1 Tax=Mucilaginibacter ginsenosidivorans TaxID=398053 RepID=A0A5B8UUT3_9SPHI|nr:helix-turn-helix transcriptional regulator [Mucilaginibacter ginsenosidivorans]QEC62535.1 helix-turn-helix transcriptional regulator [Mucilaginibacter ginsenosidivorans]
MAKKSIPADKEDEELLRRFAARVKALRKAQGFPDYEDFANARGLNRSQYGRYERGVSDIRLTTLLKVIRGLGVTPAEFFSEGFDAPG